MIKITLYAAGLALAGYLAWEEAGLRAAAQLSTTMFFSVIIGALLWRLEKGDY